MWSQFNNEKVNSNSKHNREYVDSAFNQNNNLFLALTKVLLLL